MLSPTLGLLLLNRLGANLVFGLCGVLALLGVLSVDRVDRGLVRPPGKSVQVAEGLRQPALAIPVVGLALLTMTYGGLVSYGPRVLAPDGWGSAATFFLVYGVGRALSRWLAGRSADRWGARAVILPGLMAAVIGLLLLTLAARGQPALVLLAAVLYGMGAGMAQSGALVGMLTRATPSQMPLVSTLWNLAYDGGVSVGGVVLGLIAATGGETAVLWSLGPLGALALVLFALL